IGDHRARANRKERRTEHAAPRRRRGAVRDVVHDIANPEYALEVLTYRLRVLRETLSESALGGADPVRHPKRFAEHRVSHLVEITDVDELDRVEQPQLSQPPCLRVALVEAVELVQRCLDRQIADAIDACRSADMVILLEDDDATSGACINGSRNKTAHPGADDDGVEIAFGGATRVDRNTITPSTPTEVRDGGRFTTKKPPGPHRRRRV